MFWSNWKADVLSLIAGALLPLAFAPFSWWLVVIVSLLLLLMSIQNVSATRAAWRGYLFGIGYFGIGVSWVYVSIRLFGNATTPLAATITLLFILVLSAYTALAIWVVRKLTADAPPAVLLLVFPSVWILTEWLRGWLFTGFGWLQIGYAFVDSPLAEYAPWFGTLGIGYLVLITVTAIFMMLSAGINKQMKAISLALTIGIWGVPMAMDLPTYTRMDGDAINVALVQGNVSQYIKWRKSQRQPTLNMYHQMTEQHWDKDVIIWPETAIPAFKRDVSTYLDAIHHAARLSDTILMTGLPIRGQNGDYYNALTVLGSTNLKDKATYLKRRLVPFGEYLPLKFLLEPVLGYLEIPMSDFSAGSQEKPLIKAAEHQVGVLICYEIAFAGDVMEALPEASYLVNISNDAWFGDSLGPHQHLQITRMRAIETGRYILRATNTGISAVIEPTGRVQASLANTRRGVLAGQIHSVNGQTPYSHYADYPLIAVLSVMLLLARYIRRV